MIIIVLKCNFDLTKMKVTFKQGIKHYGVPGAAFKGMQKVASLMRMRVVEDEDGKEVKRPTYFAVFDADEMQDRARQYKTRAANAKFL